MNINVLRAEYPDLEDILTAASALPDVEAALTLVRTGIDAGWDSEDLGFMVGAASFLNDPSVREQLYKFLHRRNLGWLSDYTVHEVFGQLAIWAEEGWTGHDIHSFLASIKRSEPEDIFRQIRSDRFAADTGMVRALYEQKRIEANPRRIAFARAKHPILDKLCSEYGPEHGFQAHEQLMALVRNAFGEVVYATSRKMPEEARVFVAEMYLERADNDRLRGVIKLLTEEEVFHTEVNEYSYRTRLGLDDTRHFAASVVNVAGRPVYYAVAMGYLGQLNIANWLNVMRHVERKGLSADQQELLKQQRIRLLGFANDMVGQLHAYARTAERGRDDSAGRSYKFLSHLTEFTQAAKEAGCLESDYPLASALRTAKAIICPSVDELAAYIAAIPVVAYYDAVTKNFPVEETDQREDERVMMLPSLSRTSNLSARILAYNLYLQNESSGSEQRTPVKQHLVNNVDRCSVRNEPGVFDLANLYLTSIFARSHDPQQLRAQIRILLWHYLFSYSHHVQGYNRLVEQVEMEPIPFVQRQIHFDVQNRFAYFVDPEISKGSLGTAAIGVSGFLDTISRSLNVYSVFENIEFYLDRQDAPAAVQRYFDLIKQLVTVHLKPKENSYFANGNYRHDLDPDAVGLLSCLLEDNSPSVQERVFEIEADLYASMPFRAAMIADTVPFYVSQDGNLTPERIDYYQVQLGAVVQALEILKEEFVLRTGGRYLRRKLDPQKLEDITGGFRTFYDIAMHLQPGRITGYQGGFR